MCWMVAIPIAMAAMQGASSNMQGNAATAANNDMLRKQAIQQVKQMNYTDANLKMQQADEADDLRMQKTQNNMQQIRNMGTLVAAIGESGMEGNTMKRLQRVTEGDYVREAQGLNDNYERDYAKIFGDRVSNIENTKNTITNLQKQESRVKGVFEQVIDPLGLGIGKLYDLTDIGGKKLYGDKVKAKVAGDSAKAGGK
ncbi:putative tail protein [Dickeya phage vB_DsoP_JA10]|uniref:Putative tail protein n=1 Tax=Dickeya phage vB_DsoP_JA10 TaxID=2283033 RepID=A0A384ZVX7_9CAUD|nr:internal virion protein [Dickeya phage vB_DsoP_JA10]AXG66393.1 putative tail protein [Dickeya phage vB_DsoP_JA10]